MHVSHEEKIDNSFAVNIFKSVISQDKMMETV